MSWHAKSFLKFCWAFKYFAFNWLTFLHSHSSVSSLSALHWILMPNSKPQKYRWLILHLAKLYPSCDCCMQWMISSLFGHVGFLAPMWYGQHLDSQDPNFKQTLIGRNLVCLPYKQLLSFYSPHWLCTVGSRQVTSFRLGRREVSLCKNSKLLMVKFFFDSFWCIYHGSESE